MPAAEQGGRNPFVPSTPPPVGQRGGADESAWPHSFEPWAGQSISEDADVFVETGEQEQRFHGRVVRDGLWVHVETKYERLSIPATRVNCIRWAQSRNEEGAPTDVR